MGLISSLHEVLVFDRRVRVLTEHLLYQLPHDGRILDVGCGNGLIDSLLMQARPDLKIEGMDVLVRPTSHIQVSLFDGTTFPFSGDSFDAVMFVDVLHHTLDPTVLLREAARVSKSSIIIKDHLTNGSLARPTLRFMDWIGNAHHRVNLPYNYWPKERWAEAFSQINASVSAWQSRLKLYPFPASLLFDRNLHFLARLSI